MKKVFNEDTRKFDWELTWWFDKTMYVVGWIFTLLFLAGFVEGLFSR